MIKGAGCGHSTECETEKEELLAKIEDLSTELRILEEITVKFMTGDQLIHLAMELEDLKCREAERERYERGLAGTKPARRGRAGR